MCSSSVVSTETVTSNCSTSQPQENGQNGDKKKRKNKRKKKPNAGSSQHYQLSFHLKELEEKSIFGAVFNPFLQDGGHNVFATVSGRRVSVYECIDDGSVKALQVFNDSDPQELFFAVAWSYDEMLEPVLIAAGVRGIICVISTSSGDVKHLKGHGQAVNELKIHPIDHDLLMSVSKDHSLRLWNIKTDICVAIFAGVEGHRDEVLSADFHKSGSRIVSGGMDHALKIWTLDTQEMNEAIAESKTYDHNHADRPFPTVRCQIPAFTTREIHRNYVDSVRWFGNFVMSKSCENFIALWKQGKLESEDDVDLASGQFTSDSTTTLIHDFRIENSDIWFMRFAMDKAQKTMALGNVLGKTYIWYLSPDNPDNTK